MTPEGPEEVPEDDAVIGRALRGSAIALVVLGVGAGLTWWSTRVVPVVAPAVKIETRAPEKGVPVAAKAPAVRFSKMADPGFTHFNGAAGERLLPETMGGGVTLFDHDGDGDADLLFVNGDAWDGGSRATMALYRNDAGRFTDVTREAGLDVSFYGMAAAAADADGDGDRDLFFTAVGGNRYFVNEDGRFRDATVEAGLAGPGGWSTCAAWFDGDRDGDLDLFVCSYVQWSRAVDLQIGFTLDGKERAYGPPFDFAGAHPLLYRNDGGRFADVSAAAGVQVANAATNRPLGKALGVAPVDLDADGWLDLVVANDTVQNFVLHNQKNGLAFKEIGAESGVAFDLSGRARGAMGIDAVDTGAGLAIAIGNFANEMNSLYVGEGALSFADEASSAGIGSPSRQDVTFGVLFLDYDLDGRPDLLNANGHLEEGITRAQAGQRYRQPARLFWNTGGAPMFTEAADAGDLATPLVGRGAATADFDGDGDPDLVLTQAGGAPLLLRNEQATGHHWLRVRVVGEGGNRDAIGARVDVTAGGTQRRTVMPFRGYLSQSEATLTFGVGAARRVERVRVEWPDGKARDFTDVPADQVLVVERATP